MSPIGAARRVARGRVDDAAAWRYKELLETALRLFREGGPRHVHADIADEMGLRKASLYHYVKSKQDLLVPAYQYTIANHARRLEEIASSPGSARERLARAIATHLQMNHRPR